jgi:DNA-binding helix-turn-helix protein
LIYFAIYSKIKSPQQYLQTLYLFTIAIYRNLYLYYTRFMATVKGYLRFFAIFLKGSHMSIKERIQSLCKETGITSKELESQLEFGKGYISKIDKSAPNTSKIQKIANYFNVTVDYLMTGNEGIKEKSPELTARDERDITKALNQIMDQMQKGEDGPLYYNGEEIDDTSMNLIRNAVEYALRETKKENKVKYNPTKNKK